MKKSQASITAYPSWKQINQTLAPAPFGARLDSFSCPKCVRPWRLPRELAHESTITLAANFLGAARFGLLLLTRKLPRDDAPRFAAPLGRSRQFVRIQEKRALEYPRWRSGALRSAVWKIPAGALSGESALLLMKCSCTKAIAPSDFWDRIVRRGN